MSDGIVFDNILITDDRAEADRLMEEVFDIKKSLAKATTETKENYMVQALKYANDNPWMWGVYLLAVAIPLILFIRFCCVSPVSKKDADYAQAKKTDEPTQVKYFDQNVLFLLYQKTQIFNVFFSVLFFFLTLIQDDYVQEEDDGVQITEVEDGADLNEDEEEEEEEEVQTKKKPSSPTSTTTHRRARLEQI